jgi:predicted nucleic acid-binding protein
MGEKYLIDSNLIIYFLNGSLNDDQRIQLSDIMKISFNVSFVSKIEVLGWRLHNDVSLHEAESLLQFANVFGLSDDMISETIKLKRLIQIKLPDALIATTCLLNDLILLTRNKSDFAQIKNLKVINPFE